MLPEPVHQLIHMALAEDAGSGDITTEQFIPAEHQARALIAAKADGVIAGVELVAAVFAALDPALEVRALRRDGDRVQPGDDVVVVQGAARGILTGERTALNFLQRLSGIATQTARCVAALAGSKCRLLDTRKTTPGWRWLEKMAVRAGGGTNHRAGLYDMVMVKDNHLRAAASLRALQDGIERARTLRPEIKVELEAESIGQVRDFLTLRGVDFILLDNMDLATMRECVALARGTGVKLEASGGITLERLPEVAATGVDFVSSGALTHSVQSLDLSLEFEETGRTHSPPQHGELRANRDR